MRANPSNYDAWFDYIRLEESAGEPDKVCSVWPKVPNDGAAPVLAAHLLNGSLADLSASTDIRLIIWLVTLRSMHR